MKKKAEATNEIGIICLKMILDNYRPVATIADASHFFTTTEIRDKIIEHGAFITQKEILDTLKESGYKEDVMGDLNVVWLFRKV